MPVCPRCGGSGRETVVNSGGLPEFGGTCPVCGGHGKLGPDDNSGYPAGGAGADDQAGNVTYAPKKKVTIEEYIIGLTVAATWVVVAYYGIQSLQLAWYWPVGAGFLVALAVDKLLKGPLFWLVKVVAHILIIGAVIGFISLALRLFSD